MLINQTEFARLCGVSKPTVYGHLRRGGKLTPALVKRGKRKRIDTRHPAAAEYMKLHGASAPAAAVAPEPVRKPAARKSAAAAPESVTPTKRKPGPKLASRKSAHGAALDTATIDETITAELGEDVAEIFARMRSEDLPENPTDFYSWPLRQIIGTFGSADNFKRYLECAKLIEVIEKERVATAVKTEQLTNRDVLRATLWGPLEMLCQRLLGDTSRTLARQLIMRAKAGDTAEAVEAQIRKRISTEIVNFKSKVSSIISGFNAGIK